MVDVVLTEQAIRREIRFESGCAETTVGEELVLVRVHDIRIGVRAQIRGDREERMRAQHIVVVEEHDERAVCRLGGRVRGGGNAALHVAIRNTHARVTGRTLQHGANVLLRRRVIGNAQLEVRIRLRQHRTNRGIQRRLLRIMHRHDNADDDRVGERLGLAAHARKLARRRRMRSEPRAVLTAARGSRVGDTDRAPQTAVATDRAHHGCRTMLDQYLRSRSGGMQRLLPAGIRRNETPRPASRSQRDPCSGAVRRLRQFEAELVAARPPTPRSGGARHPTHR